MLGNVKSIVAAGAGTNPRSLVRLLNGFLLDSSLWPMIPRESEDLKQYQELTDDIAAALVINSALSMLLAEDYPSLIYGSRAQELCSRISRGELDPSPLKSSEQPDTPESAREASLLSALAGRNDLLEAIRQRGQAWLSDGKLREAVYEFAQSSRPSLPAGFPEVIARHQIGSQPGGKRAYISRPAVRGSQSRPQ
jgi:hypothetical protein